MLDHSKSLDFAEINRAALDAAGAVLHRLVPGGTVRAGEYVVRNPRRADQRLGSFRLNLMTGKWADFATGDKGGDIVSFVAYCENIGQADAARLLARMVGLELEGDRRHG